MNPLNRNRIRLSALATLTGLALLAGACGSDDDPISRHESPPTTVADAGGSVPSSGSVAPNTFLTFEGRQYRLDNLIQADLIDESAFEEAGEATEADIEQEDLTVYQKADDPDAVYTYAEAIESDQVGEGVPPLWYRWALEP